ncbi:MAG: amidohydrolase, partial [Bacteroidota bacterium]
MRRLSLLLLVLSISVPAVAQRAVTEDTPLRPVTRTFALSNARVVQAPGQVLDNATVVIRDGLIEAVGINVTIPFDAEVIEADSLTVYAGFIDG